MSEKHDRGYARTAQDLENKYSFGKTFATFLGILLDSRDKVDETGSALIDEVTRSATELWRTVNEVGINVKQELLKGEIAELQKLVEVKIDTNGVSIEIQKALEEGVDKVITKMGYIFDDKGLDISKFGDAIRNLINHEGMYVTNGGKEVLTADKDGVNATNLHAKTYLIIGEDEGRSRFEDYLTDRTGCFWIGG